jgi:hypothetical protein
MPKPLGPDPAFQLFRATPGRYCVDRPLEEVMLDHHLPEPELQLITIDATRIQAIRDGYIAGIKQQAPAFAEQLAEALDNVDQLNVDQCRDLCALLQLAHETLARMRRPI